MPTPKQISKSWSAVRDLDYGATYHKVDFHFHTPASSDARGKNRYDFNPYKAPLYNPSSVGRHSWAYTKGLRAAQAKVLRSARTLADQMIARFVEEGLRMVAVTDHNSLGAVWPIAKGKTMDLAAPTWYELIHDAADHWNEQERKRRQPGDKRRDIMILPGCEISTEGVHILAVFPPSEPRRKIHFVICDLLNELGISVEEFGSNPASGKTSPRATVDAIVRKGGVPLIAHIDGTNKALMKLHPIGSTELAKVLAYANLQAVELVNPRRLSRVPDELDDKQTSLGQWISDARAAAGLDGLAYFQGSDAHDLKRIGKRWSWLMMTTPSFEGLHKALLSPSSRVRVGELAGEKPKLAFYLYGFEIQHPLFGRVRGRFNRNLNCIVGGTDCGKSVLLRLLEKAVDERSKIEGTVKLFVERRDGDDREFFCFTRQRDRVLLFEVSFDGERVKPLDLGRKDVKRRVPRPRFYEPARMQELISSPKKLQSFMSETFGKPSEKKAREFNKLFDLPKFLSAEPTPLLRVELDKHGGYEVYINLEWQRGKPTLRRFSRCSDSLKRLIVMIMVILSGRSGPVIIDEPADQFDNADITRFLVPLLKLRKGRGQVILATKNANLAVNADPENFLLLTREGTDRVEVESGFAIDVRPRREQIIKLLEGDLPSFDRRGALYHPPASTS